MSIKNLLKEELTETLGELNKTELASEEYEKIVHGATPLMDRLIKFEELDNEANKVALERQKANIEEQKMIEDREDRKVKNRISVWGIVLPLATTTGLAAAMMFMEGKGVIFTGQSDRNIISRMFRGK